MNNPNLKIIHVTDLHFFQFPKNILNLLNKRILGCINWELNRKKRFDFTQAERFLSLLAQYQNAVVVISGDLTVTALEEEFLQAKNFIDKIRMRCFPVYVIPGNHDYYTFEAVRNKRYETLFSDYRIFDKYPGVITLPNSTPLIFLHTVRANVVSSRGAIDKQQIHQLGEIITALDKPAVICGHYPVLHHTPEYDSSYFRQLKNANLLRKVLLNTKVPLLYIAGHVHHYSFNRDDRNPLVTYLCTPPLFYTRDRHGGFCEITIHENLFDVQLKTIP